MSDPYFPGQTPEPSGRHAGRVSRFLAFSAAVAVLLVLAGCSGGAAASAPAHDYGKAETAATIAYVHSSAVLKGSPDRTSLEFVKAYCVGVAKQGIKAQNRDDLLIASSDLVAGWQKAAALYCPVTMKVAG